MLSRVQELLQVFILDKMESYIRTSHKALKELTQLSRNKTPLHGKKLQKRLNIELCRITVSI